MSGLKQGKIYNLKNSWNSTYSWLNNGRREKAFAGDSYMGDFPAANIQGGRIGQAGYQRSNRCDKKTRDPLSAQ
jgi:hypothetical protein